MSQDLNGLLDNRSHIRLAKSRREFIGQSAAGFGGLALSFLLQRDQMMADAARIINPLTPKKPHSPAKAKSVIFLFMAGGPSQMDTFDPKPLLNKLEGQPLPASFGPIKSQFLKANARLLGTRRTFKKYGQSGIEVSNLFPHIAQCVDDMAVIRSCYCDIIVHSAAQYQMMSGRLVPGFPSMGSWVIYGLGSESESLPAYVVMPAPEGALEGGQPMYGQGFLPAVYQPTMLRPGANPILNLDLPKGVSRQQRRRTIDFIKEMGQASMAPEDNQISARLASYELAFQMQTAAPEVVDISKESRQTQDLYGIGEQPTDDYGRRCLLARRMVEKGVRFVCVVSGGGPAEAQWDAHSDIEDNHYRLAARTDKPVAGLLKDLKQRGMLDSTLVIWGGEFGRTALAEGRDPHALGRDHSPTGFTWWMAGGGIKGGTVFGETDELGIHAVTDRVHYRDLHTTILNQLGLDQNQLTYLHLGREERLTELHGAVIEKIVS
jgi:hypothetical protein